MLGGAVAELDGFLHESLVFFGLVCVVRRPNHALHANAAIGLWLQECVFHGGVGELDSLGCHRTP